ncbi:uncharacterized protein BDR25DRAFT_307524 [Lindgomyces ingoldianus]|uniref:Uncharacterized protein n=1 Tax=Lindgomyces ingoldianus TaxID=673940 RepID=A0ACB6QAK9_9PLEO|nr:uncharacterized protein BDR25DRAFT_307524 [Lindgomyces ingoldianus]KAF2463920.1 hypothetical protein BDR25DRAFT_307524 [Lindgomyces ingoldianus]
MAFNHASAASRPSPLHLQQAPLASYATHCSLRAGALHPLKQNPPSIVGDDFSSFDDIDIQDPIRPPPSALTAATAYDPHASSSPLDDYSPSSHIGHQRSLTDSFFDNCRPLVNRATSTLQQHTSRTSFHSPTKSLASFIPSRSAIESTASQPKFRAGAKVLSDWFNGSSGPVNLGVAPLSPSKEHLHEDYDSEEDDDDGRMMAGIFNRVPALTRSATESAPAQSKPKHTQTQSPTTGSKFAWLLSTQKNAAIPPPAPSPTYHNPSDELLNLNIPQSLFPHGPVDPLDPSAFHDLLSTAETLLTRYQNSYRALSSALSDARAEQSAQDDELDEAETRVRHLKMQLETMASRASEQDAQMHKLMEELQFERRARKEEKEARKRSLALIRGPGCAHTGCEREAASPRRRNRVSNSDVSIDSGFESECESEAASIFSRANRPTSPTDTIPSSAASEAGSPNDTTPKGKHLQPLERRSTYDKVLHGGANLEKVSWGCANCEGGPQASVWGRLAREREECSILRRRVEVLEEAVDGALSVVDGPWGM